MRPKATEDELLNAIIELATHCGWHAHHDRPARRTGNRWHTPIQGHPGYPDLCLARSGTVLHRELKGYDARGRLGKLTPTQHAWANAIDPDWQWRDNRLHFLFDVWTPDDWDNIIVPTLTAKDRP